MNGPERISACHLMTARELIEHARSDEAFDENNWVALTFALASKLELVLNEQRYGHTPGSTAEAALQAAVRDWQIP